MSSRIRHFGIVAALLLWLLGGPIRAAGGDTSFPSSGAPVVHYGGSHALLISVSKYRAWPALPDVPDEMMALSNALSRNGFEIHAPGANPSKREIEQAVRNFISTVGQERDDRLVIVFSGHGYSVGKKGYFIPADGLDPDIDPTHFADSALSLDKVVQWAKEIKSKHVLFLLDDCYSGEIFEAGNEAVRFESALDIQLHLYKLEDSANLPVREFLTAGNASEKAPPKSLLMKYFIEGLSGAADYNDDGYLSGVELALFVQQKLRIAGGYAAQFGPIRQGKSPIGQILFKADPALKSPNTAVALSTGGTIANSDLNYLIAKVATRINFQRDRYNLSDPSKVMIKFWAGWLKLRPEFGVRLEGAPDSYGKFAYDSRLAHRYVDSVARGFVAEGIDRSRIDAMWFGKGPLAARQAIVDREQTDLDDDSIAMLNRRVLLTPFVLKK
jgi:outer membrane protein OmpA-like peptidoglycan-associated protein